MIREIAEVVKDNDEEEKKEEGDKTKEDKECQFSNLHFLTHITFSILLKI